MDVAAYARQLEITLKSALEVINLLLTELLNVPNAGPPGPQVRLAKDMLDRNMKLLADLTAATNALHNAPPPPIGTVMETLSANTGGGATTKETVIFDGKKWVKYDSPEGRAIAVLVGSTSEGKPS